MKHNSLTRLLFSVAALLCVVTGCTPATPSFSDLNVTVGDRSVHASVFDTGTLNTVADTAVFSTGTNKIVVERERVMLDGTELVKLPASTTSVELAIDKTRLLRVKAGQSNIATKQLSK